MRTEVRKYFKAFILTNIVVPEFLVYGSIILYHNISQNDIGNLGRYMAHVMQCFQVYFHRRALKLVPGPPRTQGAQHGLIKEYGLNYIGIHNMI